MEKEENVYEESLGTEKTAGAEEHEKVLTVPGKFKDVDALARAYGALEAEFTRRSQRLKELEKMVENFEKGNGLSEESKAEKLKKTATARREAAKKFDEFVASVEHARTEEQPKPTIEQSLPLNAEEADSKRGLVAEKGTEMQEKVLQADGDTRLENAKLGGEGAIAPVAKRENAGVTSEELYHKVSLDEGVRLRIIGEYLASITRSGAPITTGNVGTLTSPPVKARNISEAGDMALRYFQRPLEKE